MVRMHPLTPPYEKQRLFGGSWDPALRTRWSLQQRRCAHHAVFGELIRTACHDQTDFGSDGFRIRRIADQTVPTLGKA
ncbi:MAG: hypothetical protein CMM01_23090 [Rhodopirellula sp.]|nr:hypothetical protein [Rhodopirellula sp.]